MQNSLFVWILFSLLLLPSMGHGQNIYRMNIQTHTAASQLSLMNAFQIDCLNLIQAPSVYFKTAESVTGNKKGYYFVRIRGEIPKDLNIAFASDEVYFENEDGDRTAHNFHLTKSKIAVTEDGSFSFTFLAPGEQKIIVPLMFHLKLSQGYELILELEKSGKIKTAILEPVIDLEMRKKFCLRSRISIAGGITGFSYDQKISGIQSRLSYISSQTPALSLAYNRSQSPTVEHAFAIRSAPGLIKASSQFQGDLSFRWNVASYYYQSRSMDWIRGWRTYMLHPFLRYGFQYHDLPTVALQRADEASIKSTQLANPAVGMGFNIFTKKNWMAEVNFNVQYPIYSSTDLGYNFMFDGAASMYFAITRELFVGLNWYGQFHQFDYSRGEGLDRSGKIQFLYTNIEGSIGWNF